MMIYVVRARAKLADFALRINSTPSTWGRVSACTSTGRAVDIALHVPFLLKYITLMRLSRLFLDTWVFLVKTGIFLMKMSPLFLSRIILSEERAGWSEYTLE